MFEIGFPELILIAIVGLLVIGPERLPEALRTLGLWMGRLRRSFTNVKTEIEREIGMDEIRRQLHNEAVMEEMRRIQRDVNHSVSPDLGVASQPDRSAAGNQTATNDRSHADAGADDRSHADAGADDRSHADAGADERSHADAGADERSHADAGAQPPEAPAGEVRRTPPAADEGGRNG